MASSDRKFSFEKQLAEKLTIGVDFASDLGDGEAISSVEATADDNDVLDSLSRGFDEFCIWGFGKLWRGKGLMRYRAWKLNF